MNIVRFLGKKSVITTTVGSVLGIIGIHCALTPHQVSVQSDHRWSLETHQALRKKIEPLSLRTTGIARLKSDLSRAYPCLKDIVITYSSSLEATVKLIGWRPIVLIGSFLPGSKEYVVVEGGLMLDKEFFSGDTLQNLPKLIVVGGDFEVKRHEPEFINLALNLHPTMFDDYTISWHSKTHISFEDKKNPITIVADSLSVHDRQRYEYVQRIFASEEKYNRGMKADIRLKDSLVCAPVTKMQP